MVIRRIGIVSQSSRTTPDEVARVAAALNQQVLRDFAPEWDVTATVQVYSRIREMPFGTWLMLISLAINVTADVIVRSPREGRST